MIRKLLNLFLIDLIYLKINIYQIKDDESLTKWVNIFINHKRHL